MASRGMGASFVAGLIHNKRHVLSVGTQTRGMNPRVFSVWSGSPGGSKWWGRHRRCPQGRPRHLSPRPTNPCLSRSRAPKGGGSPWDEPSVFSVWPTAPRPGPVG